MTKEELDAQITMVGDNAQIKLKNVRLRFGNPIEVREQEGTDKKGKPTMRYTMEGTFLLNEETQADQIALVKRAIQRVIAAKFPDKTKKVIISPENRCLQSGMIIDPDTEEKIERYAGCEGNMLLSTKAYLRTATSPNPVQVIGPRKTLQYGKKQWVQLTLENDGPKLIYRGCYCNIVVRIYALAANTEINTPNRVSASLEIVQHVGHGEEFSAPRADADDLMDEEEVEGLEDDDLGAGASDVDGDDDFEL